VGLPLLLAGCATQSAPWARPVKEVGEVDLSLCRSDGPVNGSAVNMGNSTQADSIAAAKREALDKASRALATHLIWRKIEPGALTSVEGEAFRCRPQAATPKPAPVVQAVAPAPVESRDIVLRIEPKSVVNNSASNVRRQRCSTVMILAAAGPVADTSFEMTLLERELLRLGINVVSSAITARLFVDAGDGHRKVEGADAKAQFSVLERALLMAKGSGADCVFQSIVFKFSEHKRFFVWDGSSAAFAETDERQYSGAAYDRRWSLQGSRLDIEGKVIEVRSGQVFAVLNLWQSSTNLLQRDLHFTATGGSLSRQPDWQQPPTEIPRVRDQVMEVVAREIAGPTSKAADEKRQPQ
jgi:hypothetical protein